MGKPLHYYQVVFNTPLTQSFTYSSPLPDLMYKRVRVSLRNRFTVGFVDARSQAPGNLDGIEIKEIVEVLDALPILSPEQRELAEWIRRQYLSSLGEALGLFFTFKTGLKASPTLNLNNRKNRETPSSNSIIQLSPIQDKQFKAIQSRLIGFHPLLIHGVTGSGKTFFYLKMSEGCLRRKQQVLILVPEITLIFQVYDLCNKLFSHLHVEMYHSKLGDKKREEVRVQVKSGEIDLVIATRSGFFLPFKDLGLIIIDEEHENSYKNNTTPRYQLKQVAYYWARVKKIPLVFVSATPTLELFYQTQIGKITEVEISERYAKAELPEISFVIREEEEKISTEVYRRVFETLEQGRQILFYINQRGFSSTVVCSNCRKDYRCPNCEITLTFHKKKYILTCHYCGFNQPFPKTCHECEGNEFQFIKAGTENYWEQVQDRFSQYRVVRFDSDSVSHPQQVKKILKEFREQKIHILVGTQMIIKGHDFKNVGLVVVLAPEKYLLLPDYRSGERMFSHIMQVAGRAGRDKKAGKGQVIVETEVPYHYALQAAQRQSFREFYQQEIEKRKGFNYPPFTKLIRLVFRGLNLKQVEEAAHQARTNILQKFGKGIILLGPSPCLLEKQSRYYRWNILLKMKQQNFFLENIEKTQLVSNPKVYVEIDVSPVDLF